MTPLVLKFGGSSFVELDAYRRVAEYVAERVAASERPVVVVVSAMSGTTGRLQEALYEVSDRPPAAASSLVLTAGEHTSVGLLVAALDRLGLTADGLLGNQIGLVATGPAPRAALQDADPAPLLGSLARAAVVVVPGGQAASDGGLLMMLGRNSADLSAVALAGALGCVECEVFSDVPGVCSADPYLVPTARVLPHVDYATMCLLSAAGAKVIHERAVRWAQRHHVKIVCRSLPPEAVCATVIADAPPVAATALYERGDVWTFPTQAARQRALRSLAEAGLDAVAVEIGTWHVVVGAQGAPAVAAGCCAEGTRSDDLTLLTVARVDGTVTHRLVPRTRGRDELRREHDRLYPAPPSTAVDLAGSDKPRSARSGLLLGDTAV